MTSITYRDMASHELAEARRLAYASHRRACLAQRLGRSAQAADDQDSMRHYAATVAAHTAEWEDHAAAVTYWTDQLEDLTS